jgi:probable rRNA maturation factor
LTKSDPKISVFNRQRGHPVDTQAVRRFLQSVVCCLRLEAGFAVALISDAAMRRYNSRYAGIDKPTDVLSFPSGKMEGTQDEPYLGDVLISVAAADRQRRNSLEEELNVLALHGVLHLLGFDHENDQGEMEALEIKLREEFQIS